LGRGCFGVEAAFKREQNVGQEQPYERESNRTEAAALEKRLAFKNGQHLEAEQHWKRGNIWRRSSI